METVAVKCIGNNTPSTSDIANFISGSANLLKRTWRNPSGCATFGFCVFDNFIPSEGVKCL